MVLFTNDFLKYGICEYNPTTPEEVAAVIGFRDAEAKAAAIEKATAEAQAAIEKMVLDALPDTPISRAVPISLAACLLLCRAKSALSRNIGHELRLQQIMQL